MQCLVVTHTQLAQSSLHLVELWSLKIVKILKHQPKFGQSLVVLPACKTDFTPCYMRISALSLSKTGIQARRVARGDGCTEAWAQNIFLPFSYFSTRSGLSLNPPNFLGGLQHYKVSGYALQTALELKP